MEAALTYRTLDFTERKTYLAAALFVIGNIVLPRICHSFTMGGPTWLPIYFFTLIGAYKYGWKVGMMTAILSPVVNSVLFGMPVVALLPVILIKSLLLAGIASAVSHKFRKASILLLAVTVLGYQFAGSLVEWAVTGSFRMAIADFSIGLPGMLVQIFGGWLVLGKLLGSK